MCEFLLSCFCSLITAHLLGLSDRLKLASTTQWRRLGRPRNNKENSSGKQRDDHLQTWLTLRWSLDVVLCGVLVSNMSAPNADAQRFSGLKEFGKLFFGRIICSSTQRRFSTSPAFPNRHCCWHYTHMHAHSCMCEYTHECRPSSENEENIQSRMCCVNGTVLNCTESPFPSSSCWNSHRKKKKLNELLVVGWERRGDRGMSYLCYIKMHVKPHMLSGLIILLGVFCSFIASTGPQGTWLRQTNLWKRCQQPSSTVTQPKKKL